MKISARFAINQMILNVPKSLKSTVQSRRVFKIQTKLPVMFIF